MADGASTFRVGAGIPSALRQFIDRISPVPDLCWALRVQLGNNDSFVAWAKTLWACYGVPKALEVELCQLSGSYMRPAAVTKGSLKGTLSQITWHEDGSYYVEGGEGRFWHFESSITRQAWAKLWSGKNATLSPEELSELVVSAPSQCHLFHTNTEQLVALGPHTPVGETFAFIKKQHNAREAPFVVNFYQDITHTTVKPEAAPAVQDMRLQHIARKPEKPTFFR